MPEVNSESEAAFALLGKRLLSNLLYQQQFEDPCIDWLDFMTFAKEFGLVSESIKDDDLFFTKTALAGDA